MRRTLEEHVTFSLALAELLRRRFPELDTDDDMNGADTVDTLTDLYWDARAGSVMMPDRVPESTDV